MHNRQDYMHSNFSVFPPGVAFWVILLAGTIVVVYLPAISGSFLWDDDAHVPRPNLRSLYGLWRIWFEVGATQQYYPVLHSTFWIQHKLWAGSANDNSDVTEVEFYVNVIVFL